MPDEKVMIIHLKIGLKKRYCYIKMSFFHLIAILKIK